MSQIVVNQDIIEMEYAVRGPIPKRAAALKKQGLPIIPTHIGNPQALGQEPISFYRQVLSLVEDPSRIERERTLNRRLQDSPDFASHEFVSAYVLELSEAILSKLETGMGMRQYTVLQKQRQRCVTHQQRLTCSMCTVPR